MSVIEQVTEQRQKLEDAVAHALEFAKSRCDAAEVAVNKSTGISVSPGSTACIPSPGRGNQRQAY